MSEKKQPFSKASHLLERAIDEAYLEEWTVLLGQEREIAEGKNVQSVVVFRLGHEWLALSTLVFSEVSPMRLVRRIPHRTNDVLRGLVNLRGQLNLCIDLAKVLEIEADSSTPSADQMMVAISLNQQKWVFVADEILGLFACDVDTLKNIPVTVAKSTANYLKGTYTFDGKSASVLDEELLFYSLERRIA